MMSKTQLQLAFATLLIAAHSYTVEVSNEAGKYKPQRFQRLDYTVRCQVISAVGGAKRAR